MSKFTIPDNKYMQRYKYKLYPTDMEKEFLDRCIDLYRYTYNWAIEEEYNQYEKYISDESDYKMLSMFDLIKKFTIYRNLEENSFLKDVPTGTLHTAFRNAVNAFTSYYKGIRNAPKYKSKKHSPNYFGIRGGRTYITGSKVKIQGIEPIDIKINTNFDIKSSPKIYSGSITKDSLGDYWINFSCIEDKKSICELTDKEQSEVIGIDVNHRKRYVLSNGHIIYGINTEKELNKIKKCSRRVAKDRRLRKIEAERTNQNIEDIPKSNRALKRETKLKKAYKKISNKTTTFIQTSTKDILKMNPKAIVMENLVAKDRGYFSNYYVTYDQFGEMRRYMEYKCNMYNIPFILADKNYPSSQICSNCGNIKKMGLGLKKYVCPVCGLRIDRDLNAAINLSRLAIV